jgi:hypothetical protein
MTTKRLAAFTILLLGAVTAVTAAVAPGSAPEIDPVAGLSPISTLGAVALLLRGRIGKRSR